MNRIEVLLWGHNRPLRQRLVCTMVSLVLAASALFAAGLETEFLSPELFPTADDTVGNYGDSQGFRLDLDGTTAIVSAGRRRSVDSSSGAALIYELIANEWQQTATLTSGEVYETDFGSRVAIDGNRAIAGVDLPFNPSVYVFEFDGSEWHQTARVFAPGGGGFFGISLDLHGDRMVVGASEDQATGAAYVYTWDGSSWGTPVRLAEGTGMEHSDFGATVAIDGDRIVVGAEAADANGVDGSGAAYVFDYDGSDWVESATLFGSDSTPQDRFGYHVSLSGSRVAVGAPDQGSGSVGSVYLFREETGWIEEEIISGSEVGATNGFGKSVSLLDDRLLVGSRSSTSGEEAFLFTFDGLSWFLQGSLQTEKGDNELFGSAVGLTDSFAFVGAPDYGCCGAAVVFSPDSEGWNRQAVLVSDETPSEDHFGWSTSMSGRRLAIGAPRDSNDGGRHAGSVYVFELDTDGWNQGEKITPLNQDQRRRFGHVVSLEEDRLLVGADGRSELVQGTAHVFDLQGGTWTETSELLPSDGLLLDRFGASVSISGNTAAVGAPENDERGIDAGAVYLFEFNGSSWIEGAKLAPNDLAQGDHFGWAVALDADRLLVSALSRDSLGSQSRGVVFSYRRDGAQWLEDGRISSVRAGETSFGRSIDLEGDRAAIGVPNSVPSRGAVYLFDFELGSWTETERIALSDSPSSDGFGTAVDLEGNYLLVSAPSDDSTGSPGSVYLFGESDDNWTLAHAMGSSEEAPFVFDFGFHTSLSKYGAASGAYSRGSLPLGPESGAVFWSALPVFTDGFESGNTNEWSAVP